MLASCTTSPAVARTQKKENLTLKSITESDHHNTMDEAQTRIAIGDKKASKVVKSIDAVADVRVCHENRAEVNCLALRTHCMNVDAKANGRQLTPL